MSDQNESNFVEDETFKDRLHSCHTCEKFTMMGLCTSDGSAMLVKAKLPASFCPKNKWIAEGG